MSDRIKVIVKPGPEEPESRDRIIRLLRRMREIGKRVLREEETRHGRTRLSPTEPAESGRHQPG